MDPVVGTLGQLIKEFFNLAYLMGINGRIPDLPIKQLLKLRSIKVKMFAPFMPEHPGFHEQCHDLAFHVVRSHCWVFHQSHISYTW